MRALSAQYFAMGAFSPGAGNLVGVAHVPVLGGTPLAQGRLLRDGPTTTIFEYISRGPNFHFWGTPG